MADKNVIKWRIEFNDSSGYSYDYTHAVAFRFVFDRTVVFLDAHDRAIAGYTNVYSVYKDHDGD